MFSSMLHPYSCIFIKIEPIVQRVVIKYMLIAGIMLIAVNQDMVLIYTNIKNP